MKIVWRERLDTFCRAHANARKWVQNWLADVEGAEWETPQDVKDRYASASFLAGNVVVFNVKGNDYRLEVVIGYRTRTLSVQWIGTHAEYDERNKRR